ncbi:MAG: hypothetical protein JNM39_00405 [Bdellovibrionaceae bacterium]|nr:hypothetical protein [Pseudobdellovibrionaceae bacterium]
MLSQFGSQGSPQKVDKTSEQTFILKKALVEAALAWWLANKKSSLWNSFRLAGPKSRLRLRLLMLVLFVGLSGCYMSGNIGELNPSSSPPLPKVFTKKVGAEFVAGSSQYEYTLLRNYKNLASSGNVIQELQATTPRGYKAFSSVQGVMISTKAVSP